MRVVVIGAGVGGMVCALRLARAGHTVTVVEQGERVGGKLNIWEPDVPGVGRFRFDTGPHVLTMPWAIRELFTDLGERMEDFLTLERVDPICRYHFAGSTPFFDAPADAEAAARAIGERFPSEERGFRELLAYAKRVHDVTVDPFLRQDFSSAVRGIPTRKQWGQLFGFLGLKPWETVHQRVCRHLKAPQLRDLFDLYAFYNGSSPYKASAIFAIIAWVQWGDGTFYLRGGLRTYAEALERLAAKLGVTVRTRTTVTQILCEGGNATGVTLADGSKLLADTVVCNADPLTTYANLLPESARPPAFRQLDTLEPSTSAFVLLLGVRGSFPHLSHYNSFLPRSVDAEFTAIFENKLPAIDPVIGVTCQSITEPSCAPEGYSNLFVMTSPPALSANKTDWTRYRSQLLELLITRCGFPKDLEARIVCEQVWTPETFSERYGAFRGSLYGLSSNGLRSAFLRPPNRSQEVSGLYFVGGGTHPGGGLPLVTLSGKIVADTVLKHKK